MNRLSRSYLTPLTLALTLLASVVFGNQPANAQIGANPKTSDSAAVNTTVVVSPNSMNNWFFHNDEAPEGINNSLGTFVHGPVTPLVGTGSAQISVTGTQRRNLATYQFAGTYLANITTLKFSTYNPSAGNGGGSNRSGYLHFNVDFNGSDTWQRRLVYVPSQNGTVVQDSWKEWDAISGGTALWKYSGPTWPAPNAIPGTSTKTWNQILTDYPGARIRATDAFVGIRVGEPYNDGYTENIDSFKFGTASGTTTFDFERGSQTLVVDDNGAQCNAPYTTIQSAVNAALPGDIVHVCAGTYTEQVSINTANLTLRGSGSSNTIIRPNSVSANTTSLTSGGPIAGLVVVNGVTGVTIQDIRVDGAGAAFNSCTPGYMGVYFRNASGTLQNSDVRNMFLPAAAGCQSVLGVFVQSRDPGVAVVSLLNNSITNYGKNGITANDDVTLAGAAGNTQLTAIGNTVTGRGPVGSGGAAQNGIQVGFGATGTLSNNIISNHSYTPPSDSATGVLLYQADANTTGNTLSQNKVGIYHIEGSGTHSGNTVSATGAGTGSANFWGIILDAPPTDRHASPYDATEGAQSNAALPTSIQTSRATNNILTSNGSTGGVAIETDGGYGAADIDFFASGNVINDWDYGIVVYQCPSGCAAGNFSSVVATKNTITNNRIGMSVEGGHINPTVRFNHNHLVGNSEYGIRNTATTTTVDGTNNWWGATTGPITPGGSPMAGDPVGPNVIYTPFLVGQDYAHLTPGNAITVTVGTTVTLDLLINASQAAIAQQSYMTFPTNMLQNILVGSNGTVTNTLTPDTTNFNQVLQNQVCNGPGACTFGNLTADPGTIAYASGVPFGNPGVTGDFRVAQVAFAANTVGDATVHWQFSPSDPANRNSKITNANSNTVSDATLYQDYVIHIVNPQFRGHVTWEGRPAQPSPLQALPINVTLTNLSSNVSYPFTTTTDANGNFAVNVNGLPSGNYFVRVKGPQYLSTVVALVTLSGLPSTPVAEFGLQPAGDASNDNLVDITDFSILHSTFGVLPFAPPYDARADFTGDNLVDSTDFSLLAGNFGRLGNRPGMAVPKDSVGSAVLEIRPQGKAPANGGTVRVGDRFVLELWVNAQAGTSVVAQQGYLTFPAKQLQLGLKPNMGPIAGNTDSVTLDNSVLGIAMQNAICNGPATCDSGGQKVPAGSLAFASSTLNPTPGAGAFRIGQVTVQATAPGRTVLHWQFSPQDSINRNTKIVTDSGVTVSQPSQFVDYVLNVLPAGK